MDFVVDFMTMVMMMLVAAILLLFEEGRALCDTRERTRTSISTTRVCTHALFVHRLMLHVPRFICLAWPCFMEAGP